MKAKKKVRLGAWLACATALLALGACAQVASDAAHSSAQPDPSSFADALSPPSGVPCRVPRPSYSLTQRRLGIQGKVRVTYVVNTVGRVDLAVVDGSSGNEALDNAAREAVVHATCAPYVVNGVAHRVVQHTTFNFALTPAIKPAQPPSPQEGAAAGAVLGAPASPPPPPAAALSLADAIQNAMLQKMGVAPDSARAAQIKGWMKRSHDDPDIARLFGNGPNHASFSALSPALRAEFAAEGVLRISPEQRNTLEEMTLKALDNAPADCGGVKDAGQITSRYMPLATMSDADVDAYYGAVFALLKQSAVQAPLARVTEEQRAQAFQQVGVSMQTILKNDPEGIRSVAAAIADPSGVSAEVWCRNTRIYTRALLATPQPFRDWSLIATGTDLKVKLAAAAQAGAPIALPGATPAEDYARQVQRRVRPNIVWAGPALDLETEVAVQCEPGGTIVSATIVRSSGNAAWDEAALRAVQHSDPMPVDATGRAPREFKLTLRPAG
jgi:TonB family protein